MYKITDNVKWVGKIDWDLRHFHGEELSTFHGSSYNSFLIQDEKTVLMDTVWGPYAQEFIENLKKEIDLTSIDYIICNHGETDHSGALPLLMKEIPDTPIYCTSNCIRSLKGQYHENWNFVPVKTGDKLNLGSCEIMFIEARMLHWPDTMFSYLTGDNILFSSDAFGQHYASEMLYNDLVDQNELYQEAMKYYVNIVSPFKKFVRDKIQEIQGMDLPIKMICPSHGVFWRDNPMQIVNTYTAWAGDYQENQITVLYDSMWHGTENMAHAITEGITKNNPHMIVKQLHLAKTDKNDVLTEIFKSKAIALGSPTVNQGLLSTVAAMLSQIKELGFQHKKAVAFGTYGWSGESAKLIHASLAESGFEMLDASPYRALWNPNDEAIAKCQQLGEALAESVQ